MSPHSAHASEQRGAPKTRSGVSRAWVFVALVIGLLVGSGATFGTLALLDANNPDQPVVIEDAALNTSQWFTDDDVFPENATLPGTRLAFGEEATVLIGTLSGSVSLATITVTSVTALTEIESELLKSAQPALTGQTLYSTKYTVTFVSGDPLAGVMIGDAMYPVDSEGAELLRVPVSGWKTCGEVALPAEIDAVLEDSAETASVEMCSVAAAPEGGAQVVGAIFAQAGGPYSLSNKGQIIWLP